MSLDQGVTDVARQQNMERDFRKQGFVPCWKLDEKAKRYASERYVFSEGTSINK